MEWSHGDLGMSLSFRAIMILYCVCCITGKLQPGKDVCIFLSHSGRTEETVNAASLVLGKGITTLGITKNEGIHLLSVLVANIACIITALISLTIV